jgi:plastocyanin
MVLRVLAVAWLSGAVIGCSGGGEEVGSTTKPAALAQTAAAVEVKGSAPKGALVMLEPVAGAAMPAGNALMDQFSKAFVPETLFVRVGQPVTFKNSEDQLHNVTVIRSRTGARVLNISQNQGDVQDHTFDQPGEYNVSCDVHPGMQATIIASTTPFAAYADDRGAFTFQNVPPGQYRLKISADGRDSDRTVEVSASGAISP